MSTCTRCNKTKSLTEFAMYYNGGEAKYRKVCKSCRKEAKKPNSPERLQQMREAAFKRKYDLSWEEYQKMFEDRDGLCDICSQSETREIKGRLMPLCVDHDHDTGTVRGLLCSNCNVAIGLLKHDPLLVKASFRYLKKGYTHASL